MKRNTKLKQNEIGITLIALVITIIVLLILAGVAIATLTGDNGILAKAARAKELTNEKEKEELKTLSKYEKTIDSVVDGKEMEDEVIESGIWRAKKNTNKDSSCVIVSLYSEYSSNLLTLGEYKEKYALHFINDLLSSEGLSYSFSSLKEVGDYLRSEMLPEFSSESYPEYCKQAAQYRNGPA